MMYLNKGSSYFHRVDNGRKGIISNQFTGKYIYIPIECFDAIMYATEKNISLDDMSTSFEDSDDRQYYLELLEILSNLGVITDKNNESTRVKINYLDTIDISLTNRCNLHCGYCCNESGNLISNDISFEEIKRMIDNVISYLNPRMINLSGGEIFIRDDIYEIIDYIRNKFKGSLSISTNGTLINEEKIDFLVKTIDLITISLDGYNEDTVSKERGKGTFKKVMKLIENLKSKGFNKINISFVVSKQTESYLENFKQLANDLQVNEIVRTFVAIGRGEHNLNYVKEEKDISFFRYNMNSNLIYDSAMVCNAGIKSIFINHDGNVYLCPLLQEEKFKICNIDEIDDLFIERVSNKSFEAYENFEKIKTKNISHCSECGHKLFCCKCPSIMNLIYDNEELLKHNCEKFKKQMSV